MLLKLTLDANSIAISHWQICIQIIFSFCERIWLDFDARDVVLFNDIKMTCVQQGFPSKPLA